MSNRVEIESDILDFKENIKTKNNKIISFIQNENCLITFWADGSESYFDFLWLRDNCPSAFHVSTLERSFRLLSIEDDLKPTKIILHEASLEIDWSNQDNSIFSYIWLWNNDYSNQKKTSSKKSNLKTWDNNHKDKIYKKKYTTLNSEKELYKWMKRLHTEGIALIECMPDEANILEKTVSKVGHLRGTNYGLVFEVKSEHSPNNQACTSEELTFHTDHAHHEYTPGYQFIHFIKNEAIGGESIFVDGFKVVERLKKEHSEYYYLLCKHSINFHFHDEEYDVMTQKTVFEEVDGKVVAINFSPHLATAFQIPHDIMRSYYLAYRCFMKMLYKPEFLIQLKIESGDLAAFDNQRILHGRRAYDINTGNRYLRGCYIDRVDFESKLKINNHRLNN